MKTRAQALLLCAVVLAVGGGLSFQFRAEIDRWIFREVPYGTGQQTAALAAALREVERDSIRSAAKMQRVMHDLYGRYQQNNAALSSTELQRLNDAIAARDLAADRRESLLDIEARKAAFRARHGMEP